MSKKRHLTRRQFLQRLAAVAGGTSALAMQGKLQLINSVLAAETNGYKSLVCIFLFGGNDSFNMFIPYDDPERTNYEAARTTLAIDKSVLHPISGNQYAFHTSMEQVRDLYDNGNIALISNVGNLIEPVDYDSYRNGSAERPAGLFSHNHMQEFWQTSFNADVATNATGWGGRMADILVSASPSALSPVYSLTGIHSWLPGASTFPLGVDPYAGVENFAFLTDGNEGGARTDSWNAILAQAYSNALEEHAAITMEATKENVALLKAELDHNSAPKFDAWSTSGNHLAAQLKMAARLIAIRQNLGQHRQIIFVGLGGWDTHGSQLTVHASRLQQLNDALDGFNNAMLELDARADNYAVPYNSVTAFTSSEFGRSLTINGDGTDHAWGAHALVMGGAVNGYQENIRSGIYGALPSLELGGIDDARDNGRTIPKIATDQYGSTLARWMGLTPAETESIFPSLTNFTGYGGGDLGFLS